MIDINIENDLDRYMNSYRGSDEYKTARSNLVSCTDLFLTGLPKEKQAEFVKLMDMHNDFYTNEIDEALHTGYCAGIVEGSR